MAIENYWSSTARNGKDVVQYAIYPLIKTVMGMLGLKSQAAGAVADVVSTAYFTGMTSHFMKQEMGGFDLIARRAVAAEMGRKPEDIKFSDYFDSKNRLIQKRMNLFKEENIFRWPVSFMPLLPTVMGHFEKKYVPNPTGAEHNKLAASEMQSKSSSAREKPPESAKEHFFDGHRLWDTAVFGSIGALWLKETYFTEKTFIYQAHKEIENNEFLGLKIGANNIAALFNHMRIDSHLETVTNKTDRDKLWPIFEELANKVNTNPNFNLSELLYLMGTGKMDVFTRDAAGKEIKDTSGHLVVDAEAWQRMQDEIKRVETIGLEGIGQENAKLQKTSLDLKAEPGFVSKIGRRLMDFEFSATGAKKVKRENFQEYVSPRDKSEVNVGI